ncbi:hypothetical protein P3X46_032461 [Hevea brasiliensis]|uniref:Uncharacterized protein n=1 Tax=Hevea brasiliensis TaxID=3981 RepID=A0ABQ9KDD3_HEVBR|nr:hypothetical protein P3X46_032461 [Hevea brasiliensis]
MNAINVILTEMPFGSSVWNCTIHNCILILTMSKPKKVTYFMNSHCFQVHLICIRVSTPILICIIMESSILWCKSMGQYVSRPIKRITIPMISTVKPYNNI